MSSMEKQRPPADGYPPTINRASSEFKEAVSHDDEYDSKRDPEAAHSPSANDDSGTVLNTEREIATHVISVDDDPTLNPWTFRAFFLGIGLSAFGATLAEIYYFKPKTILVSLMFLSIVAYVLGIAMETFIPRHGLFRYLNPHPFNKKENAFIVIMASAASSASLATEVLAVQRLYYNIKPDTVTSIFLLFSSQLLGYGIGGVMRSTLVYPSKMFYPTILPLVSMFDAFFRDGATARHRLKVFYIVFGAIFVWELVPEWMFPLLTGLSIACLVAPNNRTITRIFGGTNGDEGLGLFSICFDWQYISTGINPIALPIKALHSALAGYILCIGVLIAVYYNNVWNAQNFPFLSQLLYNENGTFYNQLLILDANFRVDPTLLAEQGLPYFSASWVVYMLSLSLGLGSTISHILLWNHDDLRHAWSWMTPSSLRKWWSEFKFRDLAFWNDDGMRKAPSDGEDIDPHYAEMLKYPDVPNSWFLITFLVSFAVALVVIYKSDSTLPWWGFVVSVLLAIICVLFFGALLAITGFWINTQTFVQMVGGYLIPGNPMACMYFVLFGYNTVYQASLLLRDLKIGQYAKLPPRATFIAQIIGTLLGSILNYFLMNSIVDNQFETLLSVQGTNIWSGQLVQQYNSQSITMGGLSHELFSIGQRYQWVTISYFIGFAAPVPFWIVHRIWPKAGANNFFMPILCTSIGFLAVGINSLFLSFFAVGYFSQWYIRTKHPQWFQKYNYLVAAALDGGTQVMVFILSFAVEGAAGNAHLFPAWWGANQGGNYDRCTYVSVL